MGFFSRKPRPIVPAGWRQVGYEEFVNLFPLEERGTAAILLAKDFKTGRAVRPYMQDGAITIGAVMNLLGYVTSERTMGLFHPWADLTQGIFNQMDKGALLPPTDSDYDNWPALIPIDYRLQLRHG